MKLIKTPTLVKYPRRRRGVIFVTAMWVIVILAAMVLIFARSMRVELSAAGNRLSTQQATTFELGAEQYVLSAVDASKPDAVTVLQTPAEQISIGDGYFWILQTDPDDDYTYAFGITDENSKLNINYPPPPDSLMQLPGMQQDIADSIIKWVGAPAAAPPLPSYKTQGQGADNSVYAMLPRPYSLKSGTFESIEELYLIRNVTDTLMYGYDLDHNGMIDRNELGSDGLAAAFNSANDTGRGIAPFITVWGTEPNTNRVNIRRVTQATLTGPLSALVKQISPQGKAGIARALTSTPSGIISTSVLDFAFQTKMSTDDLRKLEDRLTTSTATARPGLVNVNTASQQVLMCLPGMTQDIASKIVAQRSGNSGAGGLGGVLGGGGLGGAGATSSTSMAWIKDLVTTPLMAREIGPYITGRSYFYSADIVAVAGDGRAFRRVRIVVDARSTTSPPAIIFRKDLTNLGWPLSPDILAALKAHKPLPAVSGMGTGGANGLSVLSH